LAEQKKKGETAEELCKQLAKQCNEAKSEKASMKSAFDNQQKEVQYVLQQAQKVKVKHDTLHKALNEAHIKLAEGVPIIP
jgi:transposase